MTPADTEGHSPSQLRIPWFGARRVARELADKVDQLHSELKTKGDQLDRLATMGRQLVVEVKEPRSQRQMMLDQMEELGLPSFAELAIKKRDIEAQVVELSVRLERERSEAAALLEELTRQMRDVRKAIVETDDLSLLQEVGVYRYRRPLTDVVAYQGALAQIESAIEAMVKKDGGAVSATTN